MTKDKTLLLAAAKAALGMIDGLQPSFSNGVTHNGQDEGETIASGLIDDLREAIKRTEADQSTPTDKLRALGEEIVAAYKTGYAFEGRLASVVEDFVQTRRGASEATEAFLILPIVWEKDEHMEEGLIADTVFGIYTVYHDSVSKDWNWWCVGIRTTTAPRTHGHANEDEAKAAAEVHYRDRLVARALKPVYAPPAQENNDGT